MACLYAWQLGDFALGHFWLSLTWTLRHAAAYLFQTAPTLSGPKVQASTTLAPWLRASQLNLRRQGESHKTALNANKRTT
ncbi:unnamed protein product [Protopolystoma xenopodis]|uniref:Uncharacterized protein n=1 Tax=Protopolystoma xenopodis TaxID=117903 RepID=A0A3S5BM18_9PLAT|nr:unnamed protein product [Protopolystoma xenopodis]